MQVNSVQSVNTALTPGGRRPQQPNGPGRGGTRNNGARPGSRGASGQPSHSDNSKFLVARPGHAQLGDFTDPDWKKQLSQFLRVYGRTGARDFQRKASEETLRNRTDVLFKTFRLIIQDKRLNSLSDVKPRHMPRIMELWEQEGVCARARINYFTHMRWFWRICGIEIEPIRAYEKVTGEYTICRNATKDLSWKGNDVDYEEIYKKFREVDEVAARLLSAMKQFGLRMKESIALRPHESDGGNSLNVIRGSKTGRARRIEFEEFGDANYRQLLDELKDQVGPDVHLAWENRTLKQAKRAMYYIAKRCGITKKQLGVTFHGLRHDFAIDLLQTLAGQEAPIRGGVALNYRGLAKARLMITKALGHNRTEVTGAYYGSFVTMERQQLRNFQASWESIADVMADVWSLLKGQGVGNLYWIGKLALGASKTKTEAYDFVLEPGIDTQVSAMLCPQICELVIAATGYDCIVRPWEALPGLHQLLWEKDAIPVFSPVSPVDAMNKRLEALRRERLESTKE